MAEPFLTHLAVQHNVHRLRHEQGLTLLKLGHASGIRPSAIAAIENGHSPDPRMRTLIGLARALDVTVDELVTWDERDGPRPPAKHKGSAGLSQARADQTDE
jgi:transcriptional regulator with XRE-family HTH domain